MYLQGINNIVTASSASFGKAGPKSRVSKPTAKPRYEFLLGETIFTTDVETGRTNFHIQLMALPNSAGLKGREFPSPAGALIITPGDESHRRKITVSLRPTKAVGTPDKAQPARTRAQYHGRTGADDLKAVVHGFEPNTTIQLDRRFHLIPKPPKKSPAKSLNFARAPLNNAKKGPKP
jgi:hypothetical protein